MHPILWFSFLSIKVIQLEYNSNTIVLDLTVNWSTLTRVLSCNIFNTALVKVLLFMSLKFLSGLNNLRSNNSRSNLYKGNTIELKLGPYQPRLCHCFFRSCALSVILWYGCRWCKVQFLRSNLYKSNIILLDLAVPKRYQVYLKRGSKIGPNFEVFC